MADGRLTDRVIRTFKERGRYGDGNTLYLVVTPGGSKQWVQRVSIGGKSTDLGLGGYPLMSLREAREKAQVNRKLARSGSDPRMAQRSVPTFAEAAGKVIEFNRPTWRSAKHAGKWSSTLATYAFPHFGEKPVDQISSGDVMNALTPDMDGEAGDGSPGAAARKRGDEVGHSQRFQKRQSAGEAIDAALPRTPRLRAHFRALHYTEVPAAIGVIRSSGALPVTKLSVEFLVLTAARSGEVRFASWEEMDLEARTWVISAGRMKAGREHRVPLQDRALAILEEAWPLGCRSGLVFPGVSGNPLSDMTYGKLLRGLGVDCVPHGFRSSFRDWAAEQTDAPHAVMEAALAHIVSNAVEAAYARSDLFDRRRRLMDAWESYLTV